MANGNELTVVQNREANLVNLAGEKPLRVLVEPDRCLSSLKTGRKRQRPGGAARGELDPRRGAVQRRGGNYVGPVDQS